MIRESENSSKEEGRKGMKDDSSIINLTNMDDLSEFVSKIVERLTNLEKRVSDIEEELENRI